MKGHPFESRRIPFRPDPGPELDRTRLLADVASPCRPRRFLMDQQQL